jgi:hypothetical protein
VGGHLDSPEKRLTLLLHLCDKFRLFAKLSSVRVPLPISAPRDLPRAFVGMQCHNGEK